MSKRNPTYTTLLTEKYGFDCKFAMHALRLGYEGIEFLTERHLTLPVAEPNLTTLRAIRKGEVNFKECLALIEDAEVRLSALVNACEWKEDTDLISETMESIHFDHWESGEYWNAYWAEPR